MLLEVRGGASIVVVLLEMRIGIWFIRCSLGLVLVVFGEGRICLYFLRLF